MADNTVDISDTLGAIQKLLRIIDNGDGTFSVGAGLTGVDKVVKPNTGANALVVSVGPTDPISDVPVFTLFEHHQVHEGESHEYNYLITSLASGVSQDFRINVPSGLAPTTRTPHMVFGIISTGETEVYLYEDMTYAGGNGGTLQASYNRNRNSAVAPGTKIYLTPTPATTGTNIWIGLAGSGKKAGSGDRAATEWDLKPNADYLFRVTRARLETKYWYGLSGMRIWVSDANRQTSYQEHTRHTEAAHSQAKAAEELARIKFLAEAQKRQQWESDKSIMREHHFALAVAARNKQIEERRMEEERQQAIIEARLKSLKKARRALQKKRKSGE